MKPFQFQSACAVFFVIGSAANAEITRVPPGALKIPPPPLFTNSILPGTNELPRLSARKLDGFPFLPPGVYLTKPYTCMVKVPGSTHDDIAVRKAIVPTNSMPVLRPNLKAVPLGQPNK
jgi:hypothetical protein